MERAAQIRQTGGPDVIEWTDVELAAPGPGEVRMRNLAVGHGMEAFAQERYNLIGRAGHWWEELNTSACQRCGDCLPRCPHQLPIPDLLADTHQRLAAAPRRRLWG